MFCDFYNIFNNFIMTKVEKKTNKIKFCIEIKIYQN